MSRSRISLFHYDVVRELCDGCRQERFHFVPTGAHTAAGACQRCGGEGKIADFSDTALGRLVTDAAGNVVIVPRIRR